MKTREESKELKDAKQKILDAVVELLFVKGSTYFDIEEAVSDAIVIAENRHMWCDIHG